MKRLTAALIIACVVLAGGVAAAQWAAVGTGSGRAVSGSVEGLSISPAEPNGALYPGGSAAIAMTITNSNPYDVTVTSLEPSGPVVSEDPACEAAGHDVTAAGATGQWLVPANGSLDVELADAARMGTGAANECQGVAFSIPFLLG